MAESTGLEIVGRCEDCGREYIYVAHDGVACPVCGGPVRLLVADEAPKAGEDPKAEEA